MQTNTELKPEKQFKTSSNALTQYTMDLSQSTSWREFQTNLQRPHKRRFKLSRSGLYICIGLIIVAVTISVICLETDSKPENQIQKIEPSKVNLITKTDVQILLDQYNWGNPAGDTLELPFKAQTFYIKTSLDADLQSYLTDKMDRKNSRHIGIVAIEVETGRVLTLAGFNKTDDKTNPCLLSYFPAASIFKIVTAAAAIEHCGYKADTVLRYNGFKHTLYKKQLKELHNRYTNAISFKNSFAQSVNPVFGKLGVQRLGKDVLKQYADAFGFNQNLNFELPVAPSHLHINNDKYHWAEIASGFNHDTTMSPLHAAMMASAVINQGRMVAPTIIEHIVDDQGNTLYQSSPAWQGQALSADASGVLASLMETTVRSGTARKPFRNARRHKVLSKLHIGGKTGSIFNRAHDARFDWFVGFAYEKKGSGKLAIAAMVAHEEYIGIRASEYARMAITHYFKNHLAQHDAGKASPNS